MEVPSMSLLPCLLPAADRVTGAPPGRFGDPLVHAYLKFLVARVRPNSVLAAWFELKVFFSVIGKPVVAVTPADVFGFITAAHRRCFVAGRWHGAGPGRHDGGVVADGPSTLVDDQRLVWVPDRAG